jgi:hypothetical protein
MAEMQLIGCDGGNTYAYAVYDDATFEVNAIRYANPGANSLTVIINRPAGDKESIVTVPPGTAKTTQPLPGNKRFTVTPDADGFILDLIGTVFYPGI